MNKVIAHQDASGAVSPVGVFHLAELVATLPDDVEPTRANLRAVADLLDLPAGELEALIICANCPGTAAVDCTACAPLDEE